DVAVVGVDVGPRLRGAGRLACSDGLPILGLPVLGLPFLGRSRRRRQHGCDQRQARRRPPDPRPPHGQRPNRRVTGFAGSSSTPVGSLNVRRPPPGARYPTPTVWETSSLLYSRRNG